MRRLAFFGAIVVVVALTLFTVGCGDGAGGGQPTAGEWAEDFCTSVATWRDELEKIGDGVEDPSSLSADTLEQVAGEANAASDELIDDVRALGTPDLESGEEIKASVETFADSLEAERDKIAEAVGDTSELSDVASAVSAIGASLSAMGTAFQTVLGALEDADVSGELETALEEPSACDAITN